MIWKVSYCKLLTSTQAYCSKLRPVVDAEKNIALICCSGGGGGGGGGGRWGGGGGLGGEGELEIKEWVVRMSVRASEGGKSDVTVHC
jgi:hypothetical protein